MKDSELIKAVVESFIVEKKFKFKKSDIKHLLNESIDIKINQIKEENYEDVKILYIYYGGKNKNCLTFTIKDEHMKIDQIL